MEWRNLFARFKRPTAATAKAATAEDHHVEPLPALRSQLKVERTYSRQEYRKIRLGFVPNNSDEKWFVYAQDDWVYAHRHWTGFCIFQFRLERARGGYRVAEAWANRDPNQYGNDDPYDAAFDAKFLLWVIDYVVLGKDVELPSLDLQEPRSEDPAPQSRSALRRAIDRIARWTGITAVSSSVVSLVLTTEVSGLNRVMPCTQASYMPALERVMLVFFLLSLFGALVSVLLAFVARPPWGFLFGLVSFFVLSLSPYRGPSSPMAKIIGSLKTITDAELQYASLHDRAYGGWQELVREGLLDDRLEHFIGYVFSLSLDPRGYTAEARVDSPALSDPKLWTPCWDFFVTSDGVVRYSMDASHSPPGKAGQPVD